MIKTLTICILIILGLVVGWHILFPILGGIFAITGLAWAIMVAAVSVLCIATLLLFLLTGFGIIVLGVFMLVGSIMAVVFFPVLFPIIIPLLIIFLFISFFGRKRRVKE